MPIALKTVPFVSLYCVGFGAQEGANRILQNRLRGSGQDGGDVTPPQRGVSSSVTPSSASAFRYKMSAAGRYYWCWIYSGQLLCLTAIHGPSLHLC